MSESETEVSPKVRRGRRGIYLLPNLFTTAALFAGFYAIVAAINGHFTAAAVAVFVAMVLDGVDGRVARMTNTQSAFGAEYDSLSDMVSFGLAPALVVYLWALVDLGQVGWVAAFFYAAAAGLRLARFNTKVGVADKRFFQGLPSPSAAALVAGMVWVWHELGFEGTDLGIMAVIVTVIAGALMVSNITYFSFKDMDFRHRVPFFVVLVILVGLMLAALDPPKVLWAGFLLYALSGPALSVIRWRRRRTRGGEDKDESGKQ
ncbi:CDP-diacylglycerol--serine O-phosphatidyltransferase [Thioalkalivibrio denitrificans]|uniref:CDP-diacylglycerol--serine O-phosphatidyltransferase n=1 Tax=Thioalkalivibrio denitrificans TaxID=108003 RepID=A0A1V3NFH5_9GAMM|nr:CDP-diacylglycerol--serine O-phosphatidyltransferase [Thioalkalivibrio denitrificans]OOG23821.1 CDP-diacylglycerol--serine O-phosphatidyltransferase [Thioalkalivibrio denitrificans]